jgi:hypothetical protein
MLPAFLESSYKRYKDDTSTFIQWLAETAQSCGAEKSPSTSTPDPAKPGGARLKGKARKLAKQGSSTGTTANNKTSAAKPDNYVVDSSELLGLARTISNSKNSSITVPTEIIRAGIRAVSARKKCTAYFESVTNKDDDDKARDNKSHAYFTKLIEDVLMVLQPLFAVSTASKATNEQTSGSLLQDLQNRFAQLEVEEPEEVSDDIKVQQPVNKQLAVYELKAYDRKAVAEERAFAYYCLFNDLEKLRSHINKTWTDYMLEKTDLITAAAITNTAIQLAIRSQEEALKAFPGAGDYKEVVPTIIDATTSPRPGAEIEVSLNEETADWIFTPAYNILDNFCDVLQPNEVPLMKRGYLGVYNPRDDRSTMHGIEKHREDQVLLLELMPEFSFISKNKLELFAVDEVSKAIGQMALTKEIPISLAFATTVFLDIHHIMREKVERAFHDFQAIVSNAKYVMERHMDFMNNFPRPTTWPRQNDMVLRKFIWDMENTMLRDPILAGKQKLYKQVGLPYSIEVERFYLYKRQPILCGLLAFRTTLTLQDLGVTCCNAFGTAIFPAHFYNALQQKPNPVRSWANMDRLISLHTPERVFVGARPTTMVNCFKQVCLMLGQSVTDFAANRRRRAGPPTVSKNGPRGLKDTSPICEIFRQGLSEKGSMALTVHNIEELLNEQAQDEALKQNPKSKTLRHEWSRYGHLTPIQLLEALQTSLEIELPKLRFDYFGLHRQSIEMLRKLNAELKDDLTQKIGAGYIENESQLPFVGLWTILVACETEKKAENIGLKGTTSALLEKAGKVLEDFLGEKPIFLGSF